MSAEGSPARAGIVIAGGIGWKLATQLVTQVTRAGVAVILARLLTPFEFGVAALALVFTTLVFVFTDLGAALVQRREQTEDDRSTAFWMSLGTGTVITLLGIALAGPIASFFGEPEVKPLFTVLSLTFLLTAATTTQSALLHRAMAFRRVELANMTAVLAGAGTGVSVAFLGGGAWAIILQQVTHSVAYLALLWFASSWRPRFLFSRRSARTILRFSLNLTGAQLFSYVQKNIDNLLIGRFLGAAPLGVYALSYNLMLYPVTRVAEPIYQALFPVLSRMQDDHQRVVGIWLRMVRLTAALVMPAMVGLVVLAPEFVAVVLGHRWDPAAPVVQLLAWAGIVYTLNTVTLGVVLSQGLTGQIFRYTLVSAAVLVAGISIGLRFGIEGVAAGVSISVALVWPFYIRVTARALGLPLRRYWLNLTRIAAATAGMAGALVPARLLLASWGLPEAAVLAAGVAWAALVYVGLCLLWASDLRQDVAVIRGEVGSAFRRRARAHREAPAETEAGALPEEAPAG
jgi:O-antigen/teichoic acid export membrane protein